MNVLKALLFVFLGLPATPALAQSRDLLRFFPNSQVHMQPNGDLVITPASSLSLPGRMHTNIKLLQPATGVPVTDPPFAANSTVNTPGSLACLYGEVTRVTGCNPHKNFALPNGGSGTIAIVDAFHAPNAIPDLATFSVHFRLPPANIQIIYSDINGNPTNVPPAYDPGWEGEISLDIQMVHAMAPNAKIILIEAVDDSQQALYNAEILAGNLVSTAGGGQVSNSWGGSEYPTEANDDGTFVAQGAVFFFSSGDKPGTQYPCVSPNVVCVGGTTVNRTKTGDYISQTAWSDGGGGSSAYENRPAYQNVIAKIVGNTRSVPDVSSIADPSTGVYIYVTNTGGWLPIGGTSLAAPVVAAMTNFWGNRGRPFQPSSNAELTYIYKHPSLYSDVTLGGCGINNAVNGWDFCTGWGWMKGPLGLGVSQ
jgi:hypothetical protein